MSNKTTEPTNVGSQKTFFFCGRFQSFAICETVAPLLPYVEKQISSVVIKVQAMGLPVMLCTILAPLTDGYATLLMTLLSNLTAPGESRFSCIY
ncbi:MULTISPECIES: hypothetical protein [unclassified Thiocapsa]|uniref:hypothetical protein n=1 Tax=unclassified Thiocapsa TaxID=2641286 RepID=UPI0035ADC7EC